MPELEPIVIDPKTFLYKHFAIPALPEILTRLQRIMYSDDVSIEKVADLISNDPGLVAQILKIINSAYYSLPVEISKVKVAVAYLGINEIHRIVLSLSVINSLAAEEKKEFNEIWLHSVLTSLCVKPLSSIARPLVPMDEIWAAAILHDIGKMVYLKFFPDHYKALKKFSEEEGCFFSEAEKHYDLPTSAYLGTLLCGRWRLPDVVREACATHSIKNLSDFIAEKESIRLIRPIVTMANMLAVIATALLAHEKKMETSDTLIKILGMKKDNFLDLMGEVTKLKEEAKIIMSQSS